MGFFNKWSPFNAMGYGYDYVNIESTEQYACIIKVKHRKN